MDSFPNKYEGNGFRKTGVNKSTTGEKGRGKEEVRKWSAGSMNYKLRKPHLELMKTHNHLVVKHYVCHHIKID